MHFESGSIRGGLQSSAGSCSGITKRLTLGSYLTTVTRLDVLDAIAGPGPLHSIFTTGAEGQPNGMRVVSYAVGVVSRTSVPRVRRTRFSCDRLPSAFEVCAYTCALVCVCISCLCVLV